MPGGRATRFSPRKRRGRMRSRKRGKKERADPRDTSLRFGETIVNNPPRENASAGSLLCSPFRFREWSARANRPPGQLGHDSTQERVEAGGRTLVTFQSNYFVLSGRRSTVISLAKDQINEENLFLLISAVNLDKSDQARAGSGSRCRF